MKSSSIPYSASPPAGVSQAAQAALAPFGPQWSDQPGSPGVLVAAERWLEVFQALKAVGFEFLVDHTAVDYPERAPRFTVVGVIMNLATQERLIVKARLAEGASIASLTPLWESAN